MDLKQEMLDFIKKPIPAGLGIVPHSIPVLFFGNIDTATAATMAINPSSREFEQDGRILPQCAKRFVDRDELGVADENNLSGEQAERVYQSLCGYFQKRSLWDWFGPLGDLFQGRFSYCAGSLLHMNITPWASNASWNDLRSAEKKYLIQAGRPCEGVTWAQKILQTGKIKHLFINGSSACDFAIRQCGVEVANRQPVRLIDRDCEILTGTLGECKVLGWNFYLQHSVPPLKDGERQALQAEILSVCNREVSDVQ